MSLMRGLVLSSSIWLMLTSVVSAQTINQSQMRAANMARMQAELINGGLSKYSTADCMHKGGGGSCMVMNTVEGYRFQFLGGPPGWSTRRQPATLETEIIVSPDGMISQVEYNGPVRVRMNP